MSGQMTPFLTGWTKLPDETRLQVLRHAIPRSLDIGSKDMWPQDDLLEQCIPYLACPPLAALTLEVLYSQNTLVFNMYTDLKPDLPPVHCRQFVRYWNTYVEVRQVPLGGLEKLAAAFPSVHRALVNIYTFYEKGFDTAEYCKATLRALENMSVVQFPAKSLRIVYALSRLNVDLLEDPTLSKLAIVGGGEQWCHRGELPCSLEEARYGEVEVDTLENAKSGYNAESEYNGHRYTTKEMWRGPMRWNGHG